MSKFEPKFAFSINPVARQVFLVVLAVVLFMALVPHPPRLSLDRYGDKVEHALAFAALALLAVVSWPRLALLRILVALSLLGALIEVLQTIPALHRDSDVRDWVADTLALIVILGGVFAWRRGRAILQRRGI